VISESAIVCQVQPANPTIVLRGEDVSLNWESCEGNAGEAIRILYFKREMRGGGVPENIASRRETDGGFAMSAPFRDKKKFDARALQELKIFNVQTNDGSYAYTLEIQYTANGNETFIGSFRVFVEVKGK